MLYQYEMRLQVDEAADPAIRFAPFLASLPTNPHPRLSILYRTPTSWVPRKRLLRLHWHWHWHAYTIAATSHAKAQKTLQDQWSAHKDRSAQLNVLRDASRLVHPSTPQRNPNNSRPDRDSKPQTPKTPIPTPKGGKRDRHGKLISDASSKPPATPPAPTPAADSTASAASAAVEVPPMCRAQSACGSNNCKAPKGTRHLAVCTWYLAQKATGRIFTE
jgi:hypothetical protein